jgi:hypothetical protein
VSVSSYIVEGEPRCVTLLDTIATRFEIVPPADVPHLPPRDPSFKAYTRGCLYDARGVRVDLSLRLGGPGGDQSMSVDPPLLQSEQRGGTWLAGRTLYLGPFMNHYGHFITESLSRYWWHEAAGFDRVAAHPFMHDHGEVRVRAFHRYLAGLLGVPLERLTIVRSQAVFEEVVVPEQLWTYNVHVNSRMRELYGRVRTRHEGKRSSGRIFLSRTRSPRLDNAPVVEEVFAGFGFRVLYPERIPIADQLALYGNCEILAGLGGSAMHNCLFARPGLMTIEVGDTRARRGPVRMQRIANELAQVEARFIPFGDDKDSRINPKKVRRQLMEMLGERPRLGPLVALRLRRKLAALTAGRKPRRRPRQADLRGGS